MTPAEMALAFALAGGIAVGIALALIARYLHDRSRLFLALSHDGAEERARTHGLLEQTIPHLDRIETYTVRLVELERLERSNRSLRRAVEQRAAADARARRLRAARRRLS